MWLRTGVWPSLDHVFGLGHACCLSQTVGPGCGTPWRMHHRTRACASLHSPLSWSWARLVRVDQAATAQVAAARIVHVQEEGHGPSSCGACSAARHQGARGSPEGTPTEPRDPKLAAGGLQGLAHACLAIDAVIAMKRNTLVPATKASMSEESHAGAIDLQALPLAAREQQLVAGLYAQIDVGMCLSTAI